MSSCVAGSNKWISACCFERFCEQILDLLPQEAWEQMSIFVWNSISEFRVFACTNKKTKIDAVINQASAETRKLVFQFILPFGIIQFLLNIISVTNTQMSRFLSLVIV